MIGSADTSAGIPLGPKPCAVTAPRARPTGALTGASMPALGSCSTITSLASPHVLPVSASRLDRPTDQAGYCSVIANVSESTSNTTSSQAATANGACTIRDHRRSVLPGGDESRPEKWNQAATSSATTDSPSRYVAKPNLHSGN